MTEKKKYIHQETVIFKIFRISFYKMGIRKFCLRFEISWGWDK